MTIIRKHYALILLSAILFLAAYLYLHDLGTIPPGFNQDEAVNGYDAYALGHTLRDHHGIFLPRIFRSFNDTASVALTYITIPFVLIGVLSEWAVRLPVALAGIMGVLLAYLFLKEVSKKETVGLIGAFLLATSPWYITLSRFALPSNIVPFFVLLFLWLFAKSIHAQKKSLMFLFFSSTTAGLLTYAHQSTEFFTPLFIFFLSLVYFYKKRQKLFLFLGVYILSVLPLFYVILRYPADNLSRFMSEKLTSSGLSFLRDVAMRYFDYYSPSFYFGRGDTNIMHHVVGIGSLYGFLSFFLVAAIVLWCVRKKRKITYSSRAVKLICAILLYAVLAPFSASLTTARFHLLRTIELFPVITMLIALSVYYVISKISLAWLRNVALIVFIVITLINLAQFEYIYTKTYPGLMRANFQYGVKEAMQFIAANEKQYKEIFIDSGIFQGYIYYLFYSSYKPEKLNYEEINGQLTTGVYTLDNIRFVPITVAMVENAKQIKSIEEYGKIWFLIYETKDTLLIKKVI